MTNRITAKASSEGLKKIKQAIAKQPSLKKEDWVKKAIQFIRGQTIRETQVSASVSVATWNRFRQGKYKIRLESFQAFCQMLELEWQEIVDDPANELCSLYPRSNNPHEDLGDAPGIAHFFGREKELAKLEKWIVDEECRLIGIVGMAGVGKTGLSVQLTRGGIGKTDLSLELLDRIKDRFEYIIWRKLLNAPLLEEIVDDIIEVLDRDRQAQLIQRIDKKIRWLLKFIKEHKCLIILDNAESILQEGSGTGQYRQGYQNYGQFLEQLAIVDHQSCVLFTSREVPTNIQRLSGDRKPVRLLPLQGLDATAGKHIFAIISTEFAEAGSDREWEKLIELYNGNPLALELVAHYITQVYQGNITEFLREGKLILGESLNEGENERDGIRKLLDWYFQRFSEPEREVMYWLAINREPVSIDDLKEDLMLTSSRNNAGQTLQSLKLRIPLEKGYTKNTFTLQPMLIEYITERLINAICDEVSTGEIELLNSHALMKVSVNSYVKQSQKRTILLPIQDRLLKSFGSRDRLGNQLRQLIVNWQHRSINTGYFAGNIINLLSSLEVNLKGYDFSGLSIVQADLQGLELHDTNFSHCNFDRCSLTQGFGGIHAIAFSPDGQLFAIGDSQCQIRIFTVAERQPIHTFQTRGFWINSLSFSPCSKKLVSSSYGIPLLQLWDLETKQEWSLPGHTELIWTVAFHPSRSIFASGSDDKTIRIWDATTRECLRVLEGHEDWVLSVAFSGDGRVFASGGEDCTIKLWNIDTGQCLRTLTGHQDGIWSVSLNRDGTIMASSGYELDAKLWNLETGECTHTLKGHRRAIKVLAISPDGKMLATSSFDTSIRLWDIHTGECLKVFSGHTASIRTMSFSSDSKTLVSGDNEQTVKFWDVLEQKCLQTWQGYVNWIWSVAVSPDGKYIASSHLDRHVRLWEIETKNCIKTLPGHTGWIWAVTFSPDGQWLASSSEDETIRICHAKTGELRKTLVPETDEFHGIVGTIAWSPDSQLMACSYQTKAISLWNFRTKQWTVLPGEVIWSWSLAFNPGPQFYDRPMLAAADRDGTIKIWDVQTERLVGILEGHQNKVYAIAFSPDGQYLVSGSDDRTVKVWQLSTQNCLQTLAEHTEGIWSVAWSPDGKTIASGSVIGFRGATIKLWDADTGQCLHTLTGHEHTVRSLVFTPNSQTLVSGSPDSTLRLWNASMGECSNLLTIPRPYEGMKITGIAGLTEMQKQVLVALGAID
ncbi:NB-ARC domain-containing protein [Roseofilum casamattae]|uniref:NB-ARC domain-containing protein n=1 Tax=Roseofilum casamattae BLCC-M143 TaxID=3022442 RepID=A0ABT7C064_9CYAN|nr:NB-ARC domain-containing protein [Roseofilum casamattae]MDJ1184844.1 NB-ARC domain-containing protein [Roseofilum casamattae BLCC-M143]